jgi:hypothetical protein
VAVAAGLDVGIAARGPEAAGARLGERSAKLSHDGLAVVGGLMELMGVLISREIIYMDCCNRGKKTK